MPTDLTLLLPMQCMAFSVDKAAFCLPGGTHCAMAAERQN